jgi:integrase
MRLKLYRGVWCAVWRECGQTRRASFRTKDRATAERLLTDYQRASHRPADTIACIYAAYLQDKGTPRARWAWQRLEPHFAPLRPDQVNRQRCRAYVTARRQSGAGDGTTWSELTYLRAALRWHDKATPAVVELPSKPPPREHHLSREQYQRLLAAAQTPHIRLFIILALATAGRMTAILELTWDRVDFDRGIVRLGKGEQRRKGRATVPMNDTLRAALTEAAQARTCDYVVEYGGKRVGRIVKAFASTADAAGLAWCTPHVLRHTAAVGWQRLASPSQR